MNSILSEVFVLNCAYGVLGVDFSCSRSHKTCFKRVIACMVYWGCFSIVHGVSWGFKCIINLIIIINLSLKGGLRVCSSCT